MLNNKQQRFKHKNDLNLFLSKNDETSFSLFLFDIKSQFIITYHKTRFVLYRYLANNDQ